VSDFYNSILRPMKTLFVTVDPVFPPISGADLRSWQNVAAARELGPVLLLSIGRPAPDIPPSGIKVAQIGDMDASEVWRADFDVKFSAETTEQFRSVSAQFKPDVVVLESLPLANLAHIARGCAEAVIIDLHNVESDLVAQEAPRQNDPETRRAIETRAKRIGAIEQKAAALADVLWVCSLIDRDRLASDGADVTRIFVVPNGIPRSESIQDWQQYKLRRNPPTLLFIGHLHYPPNIEAALLLLDLMPALWQRMADTRLVLAGRNPHPAILSRFQPGKINIVANPSSTAALLSSADLAVMPLLRGGGTRIKALEAIAWGLPIVTTARAVEGLHLEDGIHVRIAETAGAFITAICDLCENRAQYESQRLAARRHVMENFGPEIIRKEVHAGLRLALRV
jgi:glycosyltransferase involved in cell wall biosynthesis